MALLVTIFDRQIHNPEQLINVLDIKKQFVRKGLATTDKLADLLLLLLRRYLCGVGHPFNGDEGLVKPADIARECTNMTLRADLFLKAATDSYLLPVDPAWRVKVSAVDLWSAVLDQC